MTFFSTIDINVRRRGGVNLVRNPQALHAAVMSSFPPGTVKDSDIFAAQETEVAFASIDAETDISRGEAKEHDSLTRVLWRLDNDGDVYRLYVVSPIEPDFTHIVEQAGWKGQEWRSTSYKTFLSMLEVGQTYGFRLVANTVKRNPAGNGPRKTGKIIPYIIPPEQLEWLFKRMEANGFRIVYDGDNPLVTVAKNRNLIFNKKKPEAVSTHTGEEGKKEKKTRGRKVTIRQAQFEGVLEVTDVHALKNALITGIGRGKAYGCGLLTLRKIGM
ncbi:type I-E CRISPR-associated protein Cas6/Cse3/CasE [Actinotignum urinale]|uniref:Type I-E CRISPR-associated protein Cas6/Cse3/CasE n=1 Tax=Actinotignum urinale TaxID=190146 RepID=A0AAW9HP69_9ACTO|nr:type I-E CRISPR-associated protein Cas6/Cse3/CasE [Actinotignum urinale]MDY5155557.1 type I-E CRISPR-associated protein Cas6/Cse3/CasE [Actinotignum urinale]